MSTGTEYRVKVARTPASCCAFSVVLTVVTASAVYSIDLWPILPRSGLPVRHPPGPPRVSVPGLGQGGPYTGSASTEGGGVLRGHCTVTESASCTGKNQDYNNTGNTRKTG